MATITIENGSWKVYIRKKGTALYKTFKSKEDAQLWADYKENLINLIDAFDPPMQEIITLQDAIELKIQHCIEKGTKDINDFKILPNVFEKFCSRPIHTITFQELYVYFDELMQKPIRQGGSKYDEKTGHYKLPSIHTTFRKFGYLSAVFQLIKEKGVNIDNPALKICQLIRPKLTKEKNKKR